MHFPLTIVGGIFNSPLLCVVLSGKKSSFAIILVAKSL
jgi:hypothetical protein